ncbi:MAG: folate-binding protein [Chromatiales bacterium]|nr:folate-binding protein YgfZ [Gammaproteobacteria bacterium]MBW6476885.1 folate-binding protein [Chromatiales bacterium]
MNQAWHTFLTQHGAHFDGDRVCDFGQPDAEQQAALQTDILCDLNHLSLIRASGEELRDFLQGQLSNDIRQVSDSHHQLSTYCSPKGRILALFRIFARDDACYLRLPSSMQEATLKRLRMFVLRSKVVLEPELNLLGIGLSGPHSETLLRAQLGTLPAEADEAVQVNGLTVLRVAGPHPRFEIYGEPEAIQGLWQSLSSDTRPVGPSAWDLLDIHAGLPSVLPGTNEAFVPQMLNLQLINGVNFKKGCYTGQEVVARMHYLGKLKRRMYLAKTSLNELPQPGDELSSPQSASSQGAGKVVLAAPRGDGSYSLLVVAETSVAESGQLFLERAGQHPIERLPMPYALES